MGIVETDPLVGTGIVLASRACGCECSLEGDVLNFVLEIRWMGIGMGRDGRFRTKTPVLNYREAKELRTARAMIQDRHALLLGSSRGEAGARWKLRCQAGNALLEVRTGG